MLREDRDRTSGSVQLALRLRALREAQERRDPWVIAAELDLLGEAAYEWAALIRAQTTSRATLPGATESKF